MNIILTTLNSKFIHSALSIRYLESYCKDIADIELLEFTINQNIDYIVGEIYKKNPDIIGFLLIYGIKLKPLKYVKY